MHKRSDACTFINECLCLSFVKAVERDFVIVIFDWASLLHSNRKVVVAKFATITFLFATTTTSATMNRAIREVSGGVEADIHF